MYQVRNSLKLENLSEYVNKIFFDTSAGITNRWIRHLIAGGIGTLIYTGLIAFLVEIFLLHPVSATIISFGLLEVYLYIINRKWVHNTKTNHSYTLPRYGIVTIIALLLNAGIMFLVVEVFEWWYVLGIVCATAIVPPTNFLLNYFWAFK